MTQQKRATRKRGAVKLPPPSQRSPEFVAAFNGMGRVLRVKVGRHNYAIPESWLIGATQQVGGTFRALEDAIRAWHEQAQLEARFNRQRAARKARRLKTRRGK